MKSDNTYRVPMKQWRKWTDAARYVFNEVYRYMLANPLIMSHPKAPSPDPAHWKTASWNAAWIAADAVIEAVPKRGTTVHDIDPRTGREVRRHVTQ